MMTYSVSTCKPSNNLSSRPGFWKCIAAENRMDDSFHLFSSGWKVTLYVMSLMVFQITGWRNDTVIDWGPDPSAMTLRGGLGGSENRRGTHVSSEQGLGKKYMNQEPKKKWTWCLYVNYSYNAVCLSLWHMKFECKGPCFGLQFHLCYSSHQLFFICWKRVITKHNVAAWPTLQSKKYVVCHLLLRLLCVFEICLLNSL